MYTMVKLLQRSGLRLLNHGNFDPGARGECRRCQLAGLGDGASKGLALPGGFSPPPLFVYDQRARHPFLHVFLYAALARPARM
jgi:hypothetical protein